jgi:acylphosphatase
VVSPERGPSETELIRNVMSAGKTRVARRYRISGRVQGVGFRYFAKRAARELGLCGYVKNCPDHTVEAYATGDARSLDEFRLRLSRGPRGAQVTAIEESDEPVSERYRTFSIEGGS